MDFSTRPIHCRKRIVSTYSQLFFEVLCSEAQTLCYTSTAFNYIASKLLWKRHPQGGLSDQLPSALVEDTGRRRLLRPRIHRMPQQVLLDTSDLPKVSQTSEYLRLKILKSFEVISNYLKSFETTWRHLKSKKLETFRAAAALLNNVPAKAPNGVLEDLTRSDMFIMAHLLEKTADTGRRSLCEPVPPQTGARASWAVAACSFDMKTQKGARRHGAMQDSKPLYLWNTFISWFIMVLFSQCFEWFRGVQRLLWI